MISLPYMPHFILFYEKDMLFLFVAMNITINFT